MPLFGIIPSVERKLFSAIYLSDEGKVLRLLERRPRLDAQGYFVFASPPGRYLFATRSEIKACKAGSTTVTRPPSTYPIYRFTPTDLVSKIRKYSSSSMEGIYHALIAYGYPPPHHCKYSIASPSDQCRFSCVCGKTEVQHDFERLCSHKKRSIKICRRCNFIPDQHLSRKIPFGRMCNKCGSVAGPELERMSRERIRSLRYLDEKDCRMEDPTTGEVFKDIHPQFHETSEYDYDDCRTTFWLVCSRCSTQVCSRQPGYDYDGTPRKED